MTARSKAFLVLQRAPDSAAATIVLLRALAGAFGDGTLAHAANRLAGEAGRPGVVPIDDDGLLAEVRELRARGLKRDAIGMVAMKREPYDKARRASLARRLRRKLGD